MRAMKDSGLLWIETIPDNWETYSIRHLFSFGKGLPITKDDLKESGIPVVSYGQVHSKANKGTGLCQSLIRFVDESYRDSNPESLTKIGDFIFADTSEDVAGCGNCAFVDRDTTLFAGYHTIILRSKNQTSNKYLAYLFLTDAWRKQIRERVAGIKVFSVSQKILRETTIIVPPATEQRRIVEFLDDKCARIDAAMEQTRASIEEYKKLKQSIITEAVTKGIRPNRPMKDSGIPWIGQIPEDWTIEKGRRVFQRLERPVLEDDGVITCFRDGEVTLRSRRREEGFTFSLQEIGYQGIEIGDLVVHGMDGFAGAIGISDSRGKGTPVLNVLDSSQDKKYMMYYLRSMAFNGVFIALATGIRVRSCDTNWNKLKELPYPVPSIEEQREIANYIELKCHEADDLIEKKETLLAELESYKKSMIYEYVTGKKEVLVS